MITTMTGIKTKTFNEILGTFAYIARDNDAVTDTSTQSSRSISTGIIISDGEVRSCRVGNSRMPTILYTLVCSYLNLDEPIVKTADEVLKIRYIDKMV